MEDLQVFHGNISILRFNKEKYGTTETADTYIIMSKSQAKVLKSIGKSEYVERFGKYITAFSTMHNNQLDTFVIDVEEVYIDRYNEVDISILFSNVPLPNKK